MWPLCPGPAMVMPSGLSCGCPSETPGMWVCSGVGVRGCNQTLNEDKSGPYAMKNVSLSFTSVANEV